MHANVQLPADVLAIAQTLRRTPDGHKGTYGRALIIGGSAGMSGAAGLAAMAALRGGAGLVEVATSRSAQPVVAAFDPCYLTTALGEDPLGQISAAAISRINDSITHATSAAIGPGLGRSKELDQLVSTVYQTARKPLVVDADALNALAAGGVDLSCEQPRILTPHPGEFARLMNTSTREVQHNREQLANQFAQSLANGGKSNVTLVLKGHRTIVAQADQLTVNETGNPGMATGGTGDVLTGLLAALLAQQMEPFDAARLGAWLHGAAADLATREISEVSMTACDVLNHLAGALSLAVPPSAGGCLS
ncbi:MAG: NAD(P)H-hydrate dehydratase [Pirellulales bacterium]|nr:NAD(P)H-hydrate dehydratase [Pirellulales bacterium]